MESIGSIRDKFKETDEGILRELIEIYGADERSGVKSLVAKAEKSIEKLNAERARVHAMTEFERRYPDCEFICGIDEVGRGPLAGPVMAGAVILPKGCEILYINDSKKLSEKKREELSEIIKREAVCWAIGESSHTRIDEINILQATYEAMRKAIGQLDPAPQMLLNDAVTIPEVSLPQVPIIKGDAKSVSIAAASILAKVTRDHVMEEYDAQYPGYGFASNKGYGSEMHIAAIREFGPTPIHRRSFIGNFV